MNQIKNVAIRIKNLREDLSLDAKAVAARAGISEADYIAYESGESDFSFSHLFNIAEVLGVDISDLLTGDSPKLKGYIITRSGEGLAFDRRKQYHYQHLAYNFKNKLAEPFIVTVEADRGDTIKQAHSHEGQEFDYVIEGILRIELGGNEVILRPGDSVYYDSSLPRSYYIGKWGVIRSITLDAIVVDWRAPIANLYYSGQLGAMRYDAPDGSVAGELTLKRMFGIDDGRLLSIFDTGIATKDEYLQSILGESRSDKLREVVSTLQKEQNDVIRAPIDTALIVQGAAGSGKTTVALHRIAYLLYTYRQSLLPKNMIILAPNPLFIEYISSVLPDLGVENVTQTTLSAFFISVLGKNAPKLAPMPIEWLDQQSQIEANAFQSSARFATLVEEYIVSIESALIPADDLRFGPVTLYTNAQLETIIKKDLAPFTYERRLEELIKYAKKKIKPALERVTQYLEEETAKRADVLSERMPDSIERRAMMQQLYDSRDARIKEAASEAKNYSKDLAKKLPKLIALELYLDFLGNPPASATEDERRAFSTIYERVSTLIRAKKSTRLDLPALIMIEQSVRGIKKHDYRHAVVDEAQDYTEIEMIALRNILGHESLTLVGDLMQRMPGAAVGISEWKGAIALMRGRSYLTNLKVSYRSTVEIVEAANIISHRFRVEGVYPAEPIPRHGKPVDYIQTNDKYDYHPLIRSLSNEGLKSIAIIERTTERAAKLAARLKLPLISPVSSIGLERIIVTDPINAKGLEFDAIIIADASEGIYRETPDDARLLYVAATRALHRLVVCYDGKLTGLLSQGLSEQ
ncbi:DNA helicase [Clostridia bacterium]|nr:DNA helicase [Clostridia bacterium]